MPDTGFNQIETERLVIRRFARGDAARFCTYRSIPDVALYQSWEAPYSLAEAEAFTDEMAVCHPDTEGEWFQFAVERHAEPGLIGDVAVLVPDGDPGSVEIGYSLNPTFGGHGYASEAVAAITTYCLEARGKNEVMAWTDIRNRPSIALLERLGFKRDPASRQHTMFKGAWCDEDRYVMTSQDWAARG
ncbi:MAG: GNAT family protein [Pseudomonadota bacterium]